MIKKLFIGLALLIAIQSLPLQAKWEDNVKATITGIATACAGIGASTGLWYWIRAAWRHSEERNPGGFNAPDASVIIAPLVISFVTPFIAHEIAQRLSSKEDAQKTGYKAAMADCATMAVFATASAHVNPLPILFYRAIMPSFYALYKLQPQDREDTY